MTTLTTAIQQALAELEKGDVLCEINAAHILRQAMEAAKESLARSGLTAIRLSREGDQQAAETLRAQQDRIAELESQLAAIGAGGVEPLRKRECLHQIHEPYHFRDATKMVQSGAPVVLPEPDAVLRFERSTAGKENEMPSVVSCNWLPDGEYKLYTEQQVRALLATATGLPAQADGFGSAEHWKEKAQYWAGVAHRLRQEALRGEPVGGIIAPQAQASAPIDADVQRDAKRYRWLRKQQWRDGELCVVAQPKKSVKLGSDCKSLDRLDGFIDAARAAQGGV